MTVGQARAAAPGPEVRIVASRHERSRLWREVKSANLFAGPHAFQDFFTLGGGSVFYLEADPSRWLVLGRWKESSGIGIVWSIKAGEGESSALLRAALDHGGDRGFKSLITRPLSIAQAVAYLAVGFEPFREITIFDVAVTAPLRVKPALVLPEGVTLRGLRPGDTGKVLSLDSRCFDDFWSLDRYTLAGIAHAADVNTLHLAMAEARLAGYAIAGVTAGRGYLQRLGVDPEYQGRGLGKALATWTVWWMSRNGASLITVNTQSDNERASRLYRSLGFRQAGAEKFLFAHEVSMI